MSAAPVESLVSSLGTLDVPCDRITPDEFEAVLGAHVTAPAVGVSLDGLGVSLEGTPVERDPTAATLKAATTGVTPAAFAIADYGSVVVPTTPDGCELVSLFVDRHVAVVDAADVLPDMAAAFERFGTQFRETRGSGIIATGPSATADMGSLVRGAHGPSDVHVLILEGDDD
ncbi:MAG: LUD domain-containing protein [Haloarculaceae archaeon]